MRSSRLSSGHGAAPYNRSVPAATPRTSAVQVLAGPPAFTPARLAKRLAALRAIDPAVDGVYAEFVHFLDIDGALDADEAEVVAGLLRYGPRHDLAPRVGTRVCTVTPRPGTISPWSSKATDIFRRCGLDRVRRVERGVRWFVDGGAMRGSPPSCTTA